MSIPKLLISVSIKWGFPPACFIALTVPTKVRDGTKTSSFFFMPSTSKQILRATVPFITVITSEEFVIFFKPFSNFFIYSPAEATNVDLIHLFK